MTTAYKYTTAFETCLCPNNHFTICAGFKLSSDKRSQLIVLSETGFSRLSIAADLRYNQPALGDAIRRFRETDSNKDRPHSVGRVASTSTARTAQARCLTALRWYDSPCPESLLSPNAPSYPSATTYSWLSYQILIFDILWIQWDRYFNKGVV